MKKRPTQFSFELAYEDVGIKSFRGGNIFSVLLYFHKNFLKEIVDPIFHL